MHFHPRLIRAFLLRRRLLIIKRPHFFLALPLSTVSSVVRRGSFPQNLCGWRYFDNQMYVLLSQKPRDPLRVHHLAVREIFLDSVAWSWNAEILSVNGLQCRSSTVYSVRHLGYRASFSWLRRRPLRWSNTGNKITATCNNIWFLRMLSRNVDT